MKEGLHSKNQLIDGGLVRRKYAWLNLYFIIYDLRPKKWGEQKIQDKL